jgi:hypothetical protein
VPIRWVLIRDPQKHFATQALLCTNLTVPPEQIIAWFVRRWQIETGALWADSRKCDDISVSRRNDSGQSSPSAARHQRCSASSRS